MSTTPLPYPPQKRWISHHPVATVCIALGAAAGLLCVFVGALCLFVFGILRNAEPTKMAVARAQANPAVVQQIGSPLHMGWLVSGNINENNGGGHAELEIPVIGLHGKAKIDVIADRESGNWKFTRLNVAVNGSDQTIDLLANPPPAP